MLHARRVSKHRLLCTGSQASGCVNNVEGLNCQVKIFPDSRTSYNVSLLVDASTECDYDWSYNGTNIASDGGYLRGVVLENKRDIMILPSCQSLVQYWVQCTE
ncbi:hypothetical protein AALO_G00289450, partial [Alosa alosa]